MHKNIKVKKAIKISMAALGVWLLVLILSYYYLMLHYSEEYVNYYLAALTLWLIILVFIIHFANYYVRQPLKRLDKKLGLFNEGAIFRDLFDTVSCLSDEAQEAASKLRATFDMDRMIENAKQQARYLALQNQINPHLLYNVLESIRSDALMAGMPDIAKTTEALAVFFRYTISNLENLSTLRSELGNVENYFIIQKYRFGDRIRLVLDFDPEDEDIMDYAIPKLTLQPIVENAIKHGIEPMVGDGVVKISAECTEKNIFIYVGDNGVGMDEDRVGILNDELERMDLAYQSSVSGNKGGIALLNVNTRIRLLMGEEYGLSVFSTEGHGTQVRLALPIQRQEEVTVSDGAAHQAKQMTVSDGAAHQAKQEITP